MFTTAKTGNRWTVLTDRLKNPCGPMLMRAAKLTGPTEGLTEAEAEDLAKRLNRWYYSQTKERKKNT